jgi:RNA polymerase sigma-70 factor (ECF subfamily)
MTQSDHTVDWDAVYHEIMPKIYNYFLYQTSDDIIAQDLTAQTFLKAWRYRQRYNRDLGAFNAWLFTIAKNNMMDYWRSQIIQFVDLVDSLPSEQNSIEHEIIKRQDDEQLHHLIQQLSPRERDIIALKYGAEQNNRQIAMILDLSESNIGTSLQRIIQKLRGMWKQPNHFTIKRKTTPSRKVNP